MTNEEIAKALLVQAEVIFQEAQSLQEKDGFGI